MPDAISGIDRRDPNVKQILKSLYAERDALRLAAAGVRTPIEDVPLIRGKHAMTEWLISQLEEPKGE